MPVTTLSGARIHYARAGAASPGAPVVTLVHGMTHDHRVFEAQVPALAAGHRLLLPDLRGHGGSEAAEPYGVEEYADDVLAVLDAEGVRKTHLWGNHTGAAVGLALSLRAPERVRSLVLEGAVIPGVVMPAVARRLERARRLARAEGVERAREDWLAGGEWFAAIRAAPERCRAARHAELVRGFSGAPWLSDAPPRPVAPVAPRLGEIRAPALLINGEEDVPDFIQTAQQLERSLGQARRCTIPGAGGFPGWERPEIVNASVKGFLDEVSQMTGVTT